MSKVPSSEPKPVPNQPALSRRRVFAGAGTAGALASAAVLLPLARSADPGAAAVPGAATVPDADGRYQLTQHVLRYYHTAKV